MRDVGRKVWRVNTFFVDKTTITRLLYVNISVYSLHIGWMYLFTDKHMSINE